jgi:hypothetical protein
VPSSERRRELEACAKGGVQAAGRLVFERRPPVLTSAVNYRQQGLL